jgi:ferric-dicitrate binding protein FerR (iron transport regulator)
LSADSIAHLRSRERAAFELWRDTPNGHPHALQRGDEWFTAVRALNDEINARLSAAVRTSVRNGAAL